ncbi:Putative serine/threonine-protein kinase, active [Colletotrichum destructivum]|uniref:Serine/threonine-protein kinase, active n=1 Tax=Colletotrichum destructivum TaxID=34406 RepID=A0AAX4IPJ6_9PEZI|nr:Putative serine/threonine-protein kinase, active [Colletotrichum destructivum]
MERSGRLFSECASEIWTTDELSTSTVSPNVVLQSTATSEFEHNHYDALDVVEASEAYQVPSVTITHIGVPDESMGTMQFALGNGLSSQVVQHVTSEETARILPANTVLAVKIFIARPVFGSSSAARESRSDVYATIVREIKVIGHPLLRGHENIAQLRFIAWSEKQPFPMLAMELGNYGTLDHIICSRGSDSSLSSRQKQHITLNIAVGLRAIHQVGFIHGDLKPENIIVMNHANPKRGVIAKLLDFGGSSDDTQSGPAHVTPLWCAPEVESGRKDVDWAKCDIYSYGLVVASLWGRDASDQLYSVEGLNNQLQASVLSRFTGNTPTTSETDLMTRVRRMQSSDWRDTNSLVSVLRNQLVTKLPSNDLDVPHLVGIILSTLHANSNMRPTAPELVDMFQPSFNRLRRNIPRDKLVEDEEYEEEVEEEEDEEGKKEEKEDEVRSGFKKKANQVRGLRSKYSVFADSEQIDSISEEDHEEKDSRIDIGNRTSGDHIIQGSSLLTHTLPRVLAWLYSGAARKKKRRRHTYRLQRPKNPDGSRSRAENGLAVKHMQPTGEEVGKKEEPIKGVTGAEEPEVDRASDGNLDKSVVKETAHEKVAAFDKVDIWDIGVHVSSWWTNKSRYYLSFIYRQHVAALDDIPDPVEYVRALNIEDVTISIPKDQSSMDFLCELRRKTTRWMSKVFPEVTSGSIPIRYQRRGVHAFYLAMSNIIGLAAPRNQTLGAAWMAVAAIQGHDKAMSLCPHMIPGNKLEPWAPSRLFLCLDALGGLRGAVDRLARRWPDHWAMIQQLRRQRSHLCQQDGFYFKSDCRRAVLQRYEDAATVEELEEGQFTTFTGALMAGTVSDVRSLLEGVIQNTSHPQDASDMVPILLNWLPFSGLPDHEASELVPLAYEAGAQLDIRGEIQTTHLGIKHANMSPISGSILKGRPLVALAIIALHEKLDEPIEDFQASLYFASSFLFHEIVRRMLQLHREKPWLCFEGSRRWKRKTKTLSSILRFSMLKRGGHQIVEAERFAIHGESFASAKKETERLLLESGAEPERTTVEKAIFHDETDSLRLIVGHLGPSKLFRHLRTTSFQLGRLCIELGAMNCFTYLLTQNFIRTTEGGDGGKLVHFAADRVPEKRDFLSALLKHGADIMTTDARGHTTLHLAMLRRDVVAVDMLSQHCSEEQLADLLSRHPSTGRSIFSDLILIQSPYLGIPFEGLQWLANRGGVHYYGASAESWDWPVWHNIVDRPRPTTRTAQLSQAKLVAFLLGLETFSERMQTEMCTPCQELILHHAAWNGHVDIVRLLLQHNFDVNAVSENPGWAKRDLTPTMTVLELVWTRLRSGDVPAVIQAAGRLEVIKWHESLSEVVDLLVAAGARSSTFYWDRRWAVQLEVLDRQPLGSTILFNRGEAIIGSWPEPLPSAARLAGDGRPKAAKKWTDRKYQLIPYFDSKSRQLNRRSEAGQEEARDASDCDSSTESVEDGERNLPLLFWPKKQPPRETTRALFLGGKRTPKMAGESRETLEVALAQMPRWVRTDYVEGTTTPLHIAALRNDTDTLKILLESENVPIDIEDELGFTALCLAASEGHEAAVRLLFQSGAALVKPLPTEDSKKVEPLHCCVLLPFSKPSMIELLLKLGADPNSKTAAVKNSRSFTVLTGCLIVSDRPDIVQTLINGGANLDPFQEPEWNALASAITYNRLKSLRVLLSASTTPWRGPYGINLVQFAARYAQHGDSAVKFLLDFVAEHPESPHSAGLELDAVDNFKMNALSYAAHAGNLAAVELLLARGANVNAVLRKGWTALFWAARRGNPQIVRALLTKGANVHAMDEEGSQPLTSVLNKKRTKDMDKVALILLEHNASFNGAITVKQLPKALSWAAMSGRLDCIRMLLDRGANVNRCSSNAGCAVLLSASEHGQLDAVRLLLERGADILAVDKNGRSAMFLAMDSGHRDVVNLLATRGADLNSRTENGGTALFWAASNGFLDTGKLLVERGQDVNAVDGEGETALFAAALKGHGGVVNFLLDRGADVNHRNKNASTVIIRVVDCIAQNTRLPTNLGREAGEVAALSQALLDTLGILVSRGADMAVLNEFRYFKIEHEGKTEISRDRIADGKCVFSTWSSDEEIEAMGVEWDPLNGVDAA